MGKWESLKKFLPSNRSKQGHILLVVMGMAVLTGCWLLCYQNQVYLLNNTFRNTKKALKEKQAFHLACFAFHQLKTMASDDFVATCTKKGKLSFYNVQTEYPQKLGSIELYLDNHKMGVTVFSNENLENSINCLYQSNGLRNPIQDAYCNCLNKTSWNRIQQRWDALQTKEFMPSPLFFPLVKQLDLSDKSLTITFYNPFNKPIQGQVNIQIQGYLRETNDDRASDITKKSLSPHPLKVSIDIAIAPQKTFLKNIPFAENFCIEKVKLENLTFKFESLSHYSVTYSTLYEPFAYGLKKLSLHNRKPGRWGRKSGSTSKDFARENLPLPCFKTKNWIQQLNACCFFAEKGKPYCLLNHFDLETNDRIALRDFFWNTITVNPQAAPFNFNGSKIYLKKKLNEMVFFTDDKEEKTTIKAILSHQPYPNAIAFLKQIKKFHKKIHLFENLKHRTEAFDIEAFCENIKCRMTVCRTAIDDQQRRWQIQNIKIITEKNPFFKKYF